MECLSTGHLAQHGQWQGIGLVVIVDVDVQPIHHVEVRIGEEFFHGRIFHIGCNASGHETSEIRLGR